MVSITPRLMLHVFLCFGRTDNLTLAKMSGEIESPLLHSQLSLAEMPVTAENDHATTAKVAVALSFSSVTGTLK